MDHSGWNSGGMAQWQGSPWQYPQGHLDRPAGTSSRLPAIGSERRQSNAASFKASRYSPTLSLHRPPSWQDEIGEAMPRSPSNSAAAGSFHKPEGLDTAHPQQYQRRPPKPYDIDTLNGRGNKSRSSSTPAADAIKPTAFTNASRLRHLSMSNHLGQQEAREAARSSLRLTRSPTEFVPGAMQTIPPYIPEEALSSHSPVLVEREHNRIMRAHDYDDLYRRQIPKFEPLSPPRQQHARGPSSSSDVEVWDPQTNCKRLPTEPPRETNLKEIRETYPMPPPRPGSPDEDFDGDFAEFAEHMLTLRDDIPPMEPLKHEEYPKELAAVYETDEARAEEREFYMRLLNMPTPSDPELARSLGIGEYGYRLMKMRDLVRRTKPDSTFPFFNGTEIDNAVYNYPADIQKAFLDPPPINKSQFIVVTFKHHRAEVFLHPAAQAYADTLKLGEMVVVQADRGENVGQVWHTCDSMMEAERVARNLNTDQLNNLLGFTRHYVAQAKALSPLQSNYKVQSQPGWIIRRAEGRYLLDLQRKEHDETKAKRIAAQKADDMGFPLEILDTEFQIDHQKLTIYYISSEYVRFKELVNNIYKIYKMRIWMSSINPQHPPVTYEGGF